MTLIEKNLEIYLSELRIGKLLISTPLMSHTVVGSEFTIAGARKLRFSQDPEMRIGMRSFIHCQHCYAFFSS